MFKKILLCLLSLISLFPMFSNENVLILTTTKENYEKYYNLIQINSNKINYEVELVLVKDNFTESNYSESINYLNSEIITPPLFSFYLNSNSKDVSIFGFSRNSLPPLSLTKKIIKTLNIEQKVSTEFPLYLTNLTPKPEIINIYNEYDIPILVIDGNINPEVIMNTLYTDISQENIQTHYYIFRLFNKTYYLTQNLILNVNGIFIFLIIIFINLYSKRTRFHFKHNKRYIITIPFKLLMVFVFYFISQLILEHVVKISDNSNFFLTYPRTLFIIKNMIVFFIYGISFHLIKDVTFSKSPHFYSYISLLFSLIIFFVSCVIYLPLGLFQILPIILTILFIISRRRGSKRFLLTLSPIIMILAFYTFLNKDFETFVNLFIETRYLGNILLTVLVCPYLFLHESFYRFMNKRENKMAHIGDIIRSLLTLTITITLIAIILELN